MTLNANPKPFNISDIHIVRRQQNPKFVSAIGYGGCRTARRIRSVIFRYFRKDRLCNKWSRRDGAVRVRRANAYWPVSLHSSTTMAVSGEFPSNATSQLSVSVRLPTPSSRMLVGASGASTTVSWTFDESLPYVFWAVHTYNPPSSRLALSIVSRDPVTVVRAPAVAVPAVGSK